MEVLSRNKNKQLDAMYTSLETLRKETAKRRKSNPKYTGKSVDEILYSEDGAWHGSHRSDD